ncbi:MAG: pyridoxal-dependent decarboxylase [Phycisphaerales bacterium]
MNAPDQSLFDPADWESFRALAHTMVDEMIDHLQGTRKRPVWQSPSAQARQALGQPVPRAGRDLNTVYDDFKRHILPYPVGNTHPRFWGWVIGTGTPAGVLAELLTGAMNTPVSGYDQAATLVEHQVLAWLSELLGMPADSTGVLVSGGTVANLIGLTIARDRAAGKDVRTQGVDPARHGNLAVYGSTMTHSWADRSCDWLGLGANWLRKAPVDEKHRVKVDELARMIHEDRARGVRPACIIGTAGTVSCGATDDLNALADLAAAEGIWFHVDGAFGALAKLSTTYQAVCNGMERADSIAFDLHKWGYMQYEVGVVLVRDGKAHAEAFAYSSSYLDRFRGGPAVNPIEFSERGLQLSRSFRALKVWMNMSHYGTDLIGAAIEKNINDVQYLKTRIAREPRLQQVGPADMNVICFRYIVEGMSQDKLDALNTELLVRIQESGVAVPSNARIDGRFAIRVANTNHRTTQADFDVLIDAVLATGAALEIESR